MEHGKTKNEVQSIIGQLDDGLSDDGSDIIGDFGNYIHQQYLAAVAANDAKHRFRQPKKTEVDKFRG